MHPPFFSGQSTWHDKGLDRCTSWGYPGAYDSPPSGRDLMGNPFGRGRESARVELEKQLARIIDRVEHLETAPTLALTKQQLEATADAIRSGLDRRFESVDTRIGGLDDAVDALRDKAKNLTFAIDEGIARVSRSERRVDATIKRARAQLKTLGYEDPGLEAEAAELRLVDGGRGADGEVPAVSPAVGDGGEEASSIKGVSAAALARARGF